MLPDNAELLFQKQDIDGDYCRKIINGEQKYDVVVIDGRDRVNCLKQSINALTKNGVILFDDTQRPRYKEGLEFAKTQGFKALSVEGLKPTGKVIDCTTILYRTDNCFDL